MNNKNYQYITEHDAINYFKGREGERPKIIVIHHWGKLGQSFDNVISWFCDNPNCETSAHYVVEEGKVACIVDPDHTAYHAGDWGYNIKSIGIECRPEATDADYDTVAELVADLWETYGKLPLIGHRDVPGVPTACPGIWDIKRLRAMAEEIYNHTAVSFWAKKSWEWARSKGITDGTEPKRPITREEMVTMLHRYSQLK